MAEEQAQAQEKTEDATPKRQQDAREKGQVARSREFNTMCLMMGSVLIMMVFGQRMITDLMAIMRASFVIPRQEIFSEQSMVIAFYESIGNLLMASMPVLVGLTLFAIIAPLMIGGWVFSTKSMTPNLDKLNPINGFKRIFGPVGLMELFKAIAKFFIVILLMVVLLWIQSQDLLHLGNNTLKPALHDTGQLLLIAFFVLSLSTVVVALVDVPFQVWDHKRKLKMTKQEVKDEMKETDGRPEVKSQIRSMQQELARQRMMEEVPKADVIITNPTHFAVALVYKQDKMSAPMVVAKGQDLVAQRIRTIAEQHDVTIFSAPPLARAIYHSTDINHPVPHGLYVAVAQVLAYVYQLKAKPRQAPPKPDDLPIPSEFHYE